ncbi:hypothetical protein Tco_1506379 [Tanacetum coccineum]
MKDKVMQNNSQVKFKKTKVEDHHRISSFSNKTKSVTVCNNSLKPKTSNVNVVYATCGKCVFNSNHDAYVPKFINDVNARTKKPKVVHISTRKPKRQTKQSVATPHKKTVASDTIIQKSKSYFRMLYENTSNGYSLKDKNEAKTDKTKHEIGKSDKNLLNPTKTPPQQEDKATMAIPWSFIGRNKSRVMMMVEEAQRRINGQD